MRQFKIETKSRMDYKADYYKSGYLSKFEYPYTVKAEGFKADVTVYHFQKGQPFVYKHHCTEGGEKLWQHRFWDDLRQAVLEYHKNKIKEEKL